jgi:hypothetical protein
MRDPNAGYGRALFADATAFVILLQNLAILGPGIHSELASSTSLWGRV